LIFELPLIVQEIIVIQGPTASGKTALSVELAQHFNTVVLSADSRQFYKEMSIGTAKPSKDEMLGIPHYFIDSHSIHQPVTAGSFEKEAISLLEGELANYEKIILVGGSGMFVDALCKGLDEVPVNLEIQQQLREELEVKGLEILLTELQEEDPEYYEKVDKQNSHRILRALEVIRSTGNSFSSLRNNFKNKRSFTCRYFHIDHERDILYDRINRRVDMMMEAGLLDEVMSLNEFRHISSLQTVGYKELFDFIDGKCTLEFAIDKIKQHTRNYAKRQMTWIRKNDNSIALFPQRSNNLFLDVINHLENEPTEELE